MAPGRALIVFDLDGTLIDSSEDLAAALNRALGRLVPGRPELPVEQVRTFIGSGARLLVERGLNALGAAVPLDEALETFLGEYREGLLVRTRLYPGVEAALDRLSDRRLAVLTNKPGDMSREILAGLGLTSRFAHVYGGGDLPARKPDPVGIVRLVEQSGATTGRTAMVGDSAIDVATARAAGVLAAGVTWGFDPGGVRAADPDLLVDDAGALPGALAGRGL